MPYINLPPTLSEMFWDLDRRIRALETAYRFNAPNYDVSNNPPANVRTGDIYFDTDTNSLVFWNGTDWKKVNDSNL